MQSRGDLTRILVDLALKFDRQSIVAEIKATHGPLENGDEILLTLTGELLDGTEIQGSDCVVIKGKGKDDSDKKKNGKK